MKYPFYIGLIIFWALAGCGGENNAQQKVKPFTISINSWIGFAPFYIGVEKGFFKEAGIDVKIVRIEDTGGRRSALIAGRVDALGSTLDDFVIGASQGMEAQMVMVIDESLGGDGILVQESIHTIDDLKGKKVGVQPGFVNHFYLLSLLDKMGLTPNDVVISPMDPDKAATALLNNEVDAAVTWEPHLSVIKNQKGFKLLTSTADSIGQGIIVDNLVVSNSVVANRPDDVKSLIAGWFKSVQFLQENPVEGTGIIAANFDLRPEEVKDMLSGLKYIGQVENLAFFNPSNPGNVRFLAQKAFELYLKADVIPPGKPMINLDSSINDSFVQQLSAK